MLAAMLVPDLQYGHVLAMQVTAVDEMRKAVGRFGITGKTQTQPMSQLSDGLRSRVVFAWLVRKSMLPSIVWCVLLLVFVLNARQALARLQAELFR